MDCLTQLKDAADYLSFMEHNRCVDCALEVANGGCSARLFLNALLPVIRLRNDLKDYLILVGAHNSHSGSHGMPARCSASPCSTERPRPVW